VSVFTEKLGRRLGHRVPTPWQWTAVLPSTGLIRRKPIRVLMTVVDVSVVGARLRGPQLPGVVVGSVIKLEYVQASGTAIVRRIVAVAGRAELDYGVEFMALHQLLQDRVSAQVDPSAGHLRELWDLSH
jgi:hypothetical protein